LDRVRPANRLNPGLRHAEVLDLTLGNQLLDRSCHVLDRHVRIDAVLIEEINVSGPQPLQASVRHMLDMLGLAIGPATALASLKIDVEAELRGNHHFVADRLERLAHQLFVHERPIGFGRVEMGQAVVMGGANQLDHFALVGCRAIGRTHTHAAEAKSRDFQSAFSQHALLHVFSLPSSFAQPDTMTK